jgi:hypothetical protein
MDILGDIIIVEKTKKIGDLFECLVINSSNKSQIGSLVLTKGYRIFKIELSEGVVDAIYNKDILGVIVTA